MLLRFFSDYNFILIGHRHLELRATSDIDKYFTIIIEYNYNTGGPHPM